MAIYRCKICNYIYEEEAKEISFAKLSEKFRCPKCKASKSKFVKKVIPK
ncbi:MAG: Rubredoxin [Promethearchaeota archaeon]|nr:MAG: Rubredoxin [Candidatus Lokiarchaeota archaeon]